MLQINLKDAQQFSRVWTNNGVAIILQDVHLQFATDFANVVLKSFVENAQRAAQAAAKHAADDAKPKVILET